MKKFFRAVFGQATIDQLQTGLLILRVGIGLLTIPHGIPKMMGGVDGWEQLGITFMYPLGIYFLPAVWGFLGAVTEFVGGIFLVFGFGTRIASLFLTVMMVIATAWHLQRGDVFNAYSFPLSLAVVFVAFLVVGSGKYSIDAYLIGKKTRRSASKKTELPQA